MPRLHGALGALVLALAAGLLLSEKHSILDRAGSSQGLASSNAACDAGGAASSGAFSQSLHAAGSCAQVGGQALDKDRQYADFQCGQRVVFSTCLQLLTCTCT